MRKQIVSILSLLILVSCNNTDYKPKYKDFENALEQENLKGRVKKIEQYKARISDYKTAEKENPIILFRKEFTEKGHISYQEDYDDFGQLKEVIKNTYDKNGFILETISENFELQFKSIYKSVFDTNSKKQISVHAIINDTIKIDAFFKYNEKGNLNESINYENGDTTINEIKYSYDENGKIILKTEIQKTGTEVYEYISKYKYNKDGNIIELLSRSDFAGEMKSTFEYDKKNRLRKTTVYQSGQIEKVTIFDKFYNMTLVSFYENNVLSKEMKYEYKYDNKGNWIQRNVFWKDYSANTKTTPIYTEIRKIEYYK